MTEHEAAAPAHGADDVLVPGIILAVVEHRRRIARLLDRLDRGHRAIVEAGVTALERGSLDAATLLARFHERLRAGDDNLDALMAEISAAQVTCPRSATRSRGVDAMHRAHH